jgi:hypothetical protein
LFPFFTDASSVNCETASLSVLRFEVAEHSPYHTRPPLGYLSRRISTLKSQYHSEKKSRVSYATWRIFGFIVPELGLQDLARHGIDILLGVVFRDGSQHQQALAYGGYELPIDGD